MSPSLDLDIGNTRVKWRCGKQQGSLLGLQLPELTQPVARARVSTVRANRQQITSLIQAKYGCKTLFAESVRHLRGVTNGYQNPAELGVDRWLAVIAAWHANRCACLVIDAGTALTVDSIDASGRHQGGFIVPGLITMQRQLWQTTEQVKVKSVQQPDSIQYANGTEAAVSRGTLKMCTDFLNQMVKDAADEQPTICITGGDAPMLLPHLAQPVQYVPDLVLDGLALAFD